MLTPGRVEVLGIAARPLGRSLPWATAGGLVALGWVPLAITMLRGGTDLPLAVVFAAIVGSGVLALAVDDGAAELAAALPVPLAQRRGVRLLELLALATAIGAVALVAASRRDPAVAAQLGDRLAEAAAVAAVAVTLASLADGWRLPSAGLGGAAAGSLSVGLVSVLAQRFAWLPGVARDQHHVWWWWVAAAGVATSAWCWRDPAGRRPVRSRA